MLSKQNSPATFDPSAAAKIYAAQGSNFSSGLSGKSAQTLARTAASIDDSENDLSLPTGPIGCAVADVANKNVEIAITWPSLISRFPNLLCFIWALIDHLLFRDGCGNTLELVPNAKIRLQVKKSASQ